MDQEYFSTLLGHQTRVIMFCVIFFLLSVIDLLMDVYKRSFLILIPDLWFF